MKKTLCVLAIGIALSVCAATAYFVKPSDGSVSAATVDAYNNSEITCVATDADTDYDCGKNFVDEDGDGVCDNKGSGKGHGNCGKNFVDEDGDGVCDNKGSGKGHGNCGKNFVDEDGDGVCDNKGSGKGYGNCGNKGSGNGNANGGHGKGYRGNCGR